MNETEKTIAAFKELGVTEFTTQRMPHADYVGQEYLNEDEGKLYPKKPRHTTGEEILDRRKWYLRQNYRGYNIQFGPKRLDAEKEPADRMYLPYIFVDDVDALIYKNIKNDGISINILIESSPKNYHGWIKVAEQPLSYTKMRAAQTALVTRYGLDLGANNPGQLGKLPGMQNRKPAYTDNWVKLAGIAYDWKENARIIGELAEKFMSDKKAEEIERRLKAQSIDRPNNANRPLSEHIFKKTAETPLGVSSEDDWKVIMSCLWWGYHQDDIISQLTQQYLNTADPQQIRKKGNVESYIRRSVEKAAQVADFQR